MAATPISHQVFQVDRQLFDQAAHSIIGIDRGCSLTKAVFLSNKDDETTSSHYALQCAVFRNSDFEGCLHFLKEHAKFPGNEGIRVTGVGCDKFRDLIENVLGRKSVFVNEYSTNSRGLQFLLKAAVDKNELFYADGLPEKIKDYELSEAMRVQMAQVYAECTRNNGPDQEALLPCIFVLVGSAGVVVTLPPEGKARFGSLSMVCGKSLLGLGRALTGAADYDELMDLAAKGNIQNVDTTIGEFIQDAPDSPYGRFPPEIPLFSFGKLVDHDLSLESLETADVALAVIRLVSQYIQDAVVATTAREGINRVIFGGHGIRSEVMRRALHGGLEASMNGMLDIKFLRTGNTGAIGAMISNDEDVSQ